MSDQIKLSKTTLFLLVVVVLLVIIGLLVFFLVLKPAGQPISSGEDAQKFGQEVSKNIEEIKSTLTELNKNLKK